MNVKNQDALRTHRHFERGVASILSVIFFVLVASVVTLGFMRITLLESEQSLEDSLSKSALAAAYSGVDDAKRALYHCMQSPSDAICQGTSAASIYNQGCPGFYANSAVRTALNITSSYNAGNESMQVGGDPAANERYTCTIITGDTLEASGMLNVDSAGNGTVLIPLRGVTAATQVMISWARTGNLTGLTYGNDTTYGNYRSPHAEGNVNKWSQNWPALLRASLYSYPKSTGVTYGATLNDNNTNISEKTSFLYPFDGALATNRRAYGALPNRQLVDCDALATFRCQFTVDNIPATDTNDVYLQLTSLNNDTEYSIYLFNGGTPVLFDDVNPTIDSTGVVGDVFRRVKVNLSPGDTPILPNAIDTGSGVCKTFIVGAALWNDPCYFD